MNTLAAKSILILEDDVPLAHAMSEYLLHVYQPASVKTFETLADLKAHGLHGDLLISDLGLPDSTPQNTASYLLSQVNAIRIVCHSAAVKEGKALGRQSLGQIIYMEKGDDLDWLGELLTLPNSSD